MFDENTTRGRVLRATMALASGKKWDDVSLADIAAESHVSLAELRSEFGSKVEILRGFQREIDVALLRRTEAEKPEGTAKDRLADVILTRLEILAPYKLALRSIRAAVRRRPAEAALLACGAAVSSGWTLNAAGIPAQGAKGRARVAGLMSIMARVFPVWLEDGPDNARTMAALDRRLARGEHWLKMMETVCADACGAFRRLRCLCGGRPRSKAAAPDPAPVTPPPPPSSHPAPEAPITV